ncbi:hypothetical protein BDW62DRAFT_188586, partial [Aspergillus aurantiobrunneus]
MSTDRRGIEVSRLWKFSLACSLSIAVGCSLGIMFPSQGLVSSGSICLVVRTSDGSTARSRRVL